MKGLLIYSFLIRLPLILVCDREKFETGCLRLYVESTSLVIKISSYRYIDI